MSTETVSLIDNIKQLYPQVGKKAPFVIALAKHMGRSELTLLNHWFCRFWRVPEDDQEEVIAFMQKWIANLNKK